MKDQSSPEEAKPCFEKAIEITNAFFDGQKGQDGSHELAIAVLERRMGLTLRRLDDLDGALEYLTSAIEKFRSKKPEGYAYVRSLDSLSLVCFMKSELDQAGLYQDRCQKVLRNILSRLLPHLAPDERKTLLQSIGDIFDGGLSMAYERPADSRIAALSASWLLNSKGISQEAIAESSLLSSAEAVPLVNELRSVRERLSNLILNADDQLDDDTKNQVSTLENKQQQLQQEIASHGLGINSNDPWVSAGSVMSNLPFGSVFINVARIRRFNFEGRTESEMFKDDVYVAWLIPAVGEGQITVVPLGKADEIDELVRDARVGLDSELLTQLQEDGEQKAELEFHKKVKTLSRKVFAPLEPYLQNAENLLISPDGELWNIPWETLVTKDSEYVTEKFETRYLLSGRELVYQRSARALVGKPAIFADPDYDLDASATKPHEGHMQSQLRSSSPARFRRLPNSATEVYAIRPKIESLTGESAELFLQADAQEATFKELHRPRMLIISTHGFFDDEGSRSTISNPESNPLLRCGLAFAGCNNRDKIKRDSAQDGILTGLEIVGTDLRGTELVVLSACETGIGQIQSGEGVAGLRQAFQLAGAESVLASLWQVDDAETARLMNLFFDNLSAGMTKSEALRQAKLSRIKARRARHGAAHPFFWAAFTLTGQD